MQHFSADNNGVSKNHLPKVPDPLQDDHEIRVLIVDDEKVIRNLLQLSMQRMGYSVVTAGNGREALEIFREQQFDLVLLDVLMPELDGFQVCSAIRKVSDVSIVMLTALNRADDVVSGLEIGADTYITKPFTFREVEARIRAILRRAANKKGPSLTHILEEGDVKLDSGLRAATVDGGLVELTRTEYQLMHHLMSHVDRPLSKGYLLENVWGYEDSNTNSNIVELAVRRLRKKLEEDPSNPNRLVTVRGVGYKFCPKDIGPSASTPSVAEKPHHRRTPVERWSPDMAKIPENGVKQPAAV